MIRQLIDRGLVKVGGEEDSLGRPFLFITTRAFLDMFGLGRVQELPDYETLGRPQTADYIELVEVEVEEDSADGDSPVATTEQDSAEDQRAA